MLTGNDQELLPQEEPQQAELPCTTSEPSAACADGLNVMACRPARQAGSLVTTLPSGVPALGDLRAAPPRSMTPERAVAIMTIQERESFLAEARRRARASCWQRPRPATG